MDIFAWKHISWSYQVSTEVVLQGYISWILYLVFVKDFLPHCSAEGQKDNQLRDSCFQADPDLWSPGNEQGRRKDSCPYVINYHNTFLIWKTLICLNVLLWFLKMKTDTSYSVFPETSTSVSCCSLPSKQSNTWTTNTCSQHLRCTGWECDALLSGTFFDKFIHLIFLSPLRFISSGLNLLKPFCYCCSINWNTSQCLKLQRV